MNNDILYNVKMHADLNNLHISGAERIVKFNQINSVVLDLIKRVNYKLSDFSDIFIKIQKIKNNILFFNALQYDLYKTIDFNDAYNYITKIFINILDENKLRQIFNLFFKMEHLRGAAIIDINTLERVDTNLDRGIRTTVVDCNEKRNLINKDHALEAIILATKTINAPGIISEICMSDDINYTHGYITFNNRFIVFRNFRPANFRGGRLYLFDSNKSTILECIKYLENTPVLVKNVPKNINKIVNSTFNAIDN